ncbi:DUF2332 domain-containing protein [Halalkalibacillus sediminis]|uniref:DUF2332 domain-containing protein n=1 Tax=Halalkalibacillus sediminis TaxID=2018042 RepID=A0A2I0QR17_9BACI|nr:DUF2332 domain-containing protein [Halalkalibacillus sediminis]PKR76768.1 DUF2332 domain-containing protein [Halalkalibacillus sediminis]
MLINNLANRFQRFAVDEAVGSCELYKELSFQIAEDEEILEMCTYAQKGQPAPNLLFGAVHYLQLKGNSHGLKEFYQSLVDNPQPPKEAFPYFKDFCQKHRNEIISLLETKLVQTNEVRRCAYLYPAFCYIHEKVKRPLALIEIGTSAGLQLLFDHYQYSYETEEVFGDRKSDVFVTSEVRSEQPPFLYDTPPPVSYRFGLDLHINDLSDPEDELWLKALIWPDHSHRRDLFENASEYVKSNPLNLIEGDGVALLPGIVEQIPQESVICVFHTHVANQIPDEGKAQLVQTIDYIGEKRDIFHLYNNMYDAELHLDYIVGGDKTTETIGQTNGHGRWFEWRVTN